MTECPICGRAALSFREVGDDHWRNLGRQLLDETGSSGSVDGKEKFA
jgi:hypothetical protein